MKLLTNLSFIAAAVVALGSSAALADDSQLQNRLAAQYAQEASRTSNSPTVALYSTRNDNGATQDEHSQVRFEVRSNGHGQVYGYYVSVR
jgi:hypothetical protein